MLQTDESYLAKNFQSFTAAIPSLSSEQRRQHALLRDGEIIEFFDTAGDAYRAGRKLYPDHKFSIQEVRDVYPDDSYQYHAVHH